MNKAIKTLPLLIGLVTGSAHATNYTMEARGDAMGGTGVVAANFLTAPFYNPAITAIYRRNDDLGMIAPGLGLSYSDEHKLVDDLKKSRDLIKEAVGGNYSNAPQLQTTLDNLKGDIASLKFGGVAAFAIPNQFIAANLFGKAYSESFAAMDIYDGYTTGANANVNTAVNAELSSVNAVAVGVTEVGLSIAKYQTFLGQHLAFGVSPKLQRVYTYVYSANLDNYDIKDVKENGTGETMFNLDAGFLWFYGPVRVGISANNFVSRDIKTVTQSFNITSQIDSGETRSYSLGYEYQIRPQYTVGAGIVADYFTLSVDYDLNEDERYTNFKDNTQMIRVGAELDILRQLRLRVGWNDNLAYNDVDDTLTAGISISPLNLFQLDLGASYTNEDSMGAYVNFVTSY